MDRLSKSMWIEETLVLFSFSSLPLKNPRSRQSSVANSGDWLIVFYWSVFLDSSGKTLRFIFMDLYSVFCGKVLFKFSDRFWNLIYACKSYLKSKKRYFIVLAWICILWNKLRSNRWLVKFCQNGGDLMQEKVWKGGGQLGLNRNSKTCKIGILDYGYFWIIFL